MSRPIKHVLGQAGPQDQGDIEEAGAGEDGLMGKLLQADEMLPGPHLVQHPVQQLPAHPVPAVDLLLGLAQKLGQIALGFEIQHLVGAEIRGGHGHAVHIGGMTTPQKNRKILGIKK